MQVPRTVRLGALVALLLADIVLVVYVLRGGSLTSTPEAPDPSPASASTTTPTTSATTSPATAPDAGHRALAVLDSRTAYRAAPAGCTGTDPKVERSTDGGRTWAATGRPTGVGSVTRIEFTSASSGFLVGTSTRDCRLQVLTTGDGGATWSDPAGAETYWSLLPATPTKVNSASGRDVSPCESGDVVQVGRVTDAKAVALCAKGVVRATSDGGTTWTTQATVAGALTLAVDRSAANRVVLAGRSEECSGATVWTLGAGAKDATVAACVGLPAKDVPSVSLGSARSGATWLVTGTTAWTSRGDLATWSSAS